MATKLFKIGEYSYYGKWRLTLNGDTINVKGIDFQTGEVMEERDFEAKTGKAKDPVDTRPLDEYLASVSTIYWGDKMMEWVKKKVPDFQERSYFAGGAW